MNSWVVVWGDVSGRSVIDAPSSAPGRTDRAIVHVVRRGWGRVEREPKIRVRGGAGCVPYGARRWRGDKKPPCQSRGAIAIADPLSRRSLCRSWHLTRIATSWGCSVAGCRASQGRFPPPLWIRQSSVVGEDGTGHKIACQGNARCPTRGSPRGKGSSIWERTPATNAMFSASTTTVSSARRLRRGTSTRTTTT
jgi:hypothetical protein